jgi:lipopolysaccharide export LptBFGC system permease protein LptF
MNAEGHSPDPVVGTVLHDPAHDLAQHEEVQKPEEQDHAIEVAHAWEHFNENWKFFAGFLSIILLTVVAFNINFGPWNTTAVLVLAALRSGFIAYFLSHLFKDFSFVFRTLFFTAIFLTGMIFLSLWDSTVRPGWIGNPITLPDKFHESPNESSNR